MLPLIVAGVVVGAAALVGGVYKHVTSNENNGKEGAAEDLGSFAVWGQPDTGKTTFIARLRGLPPISEKLQTTSMKSLPEFEVKSEDGRRYKIERLVDMPGTRDRLSAWLKQVVLNKNVFYIVDLSRLPEKNYCIKVRFDIEQTVAALGSRDEKKRLNIIGTHLDLSEWASVDTARVNNVVMQNSKMREIRELLKEVEGYVYSVDLTDEESFARLLQDVINDIKG